MTNSIHLFLIVLFSILININIVIVVIIIIIIISQIQVRSPSATLMCPRIIWQTLVAKTAHTLFLRHHEFIIDLHRKRKIATQICNFLKSLRYEMQNKSHLSHQWLTLVTFVRQMTGTWFRKILILHISCGISRNIHPGKARSMRLFVN